MSVHDTILNRHSVRKFSDRKVEKGKLDRILNAARLAPSWRNQQCWHFIVVDDDITRNEVIRSTHIFNQTWLGKEPAIVVLCADPQQSGFNNDQWYYLVDTAIAYTQMMLEATENGLGMCFIGAFNESKIKHALSIPDHVRVVGLTPVGYPADNKGVIDNLTTLVVKSHKRKDLDQIVSLNSWTNPYKTEV